MADVRPYRYLNADGVWPGFDWHGLERLHDGTLQLMPLPRLDGPMPAAKASAGGTPSPAGLAVAEDGTVLFTDPGRHAIYRVDGCTGLAEREPCLGGEGEGTTMLSRPVALAIGPLRRVLYVADADNHRVQLIDLESMAVVETIAGFDRPESIAVDVEGRLYVVDRGRRRVDQISASGDRVDAFWDATAASGRLSDPQLVACDGERVFVLDGSDRHIAVLEPSGHAIAEFPTIEATPSALAVADGVVYVGDSVRRRVTVFRAGRTGAFVHAGDAAGYDGPVAALAADGGGGVVVLMGGGAAPLRLVIDGSYRADGWLVSPPIHFDEREHYWNRLSAAVTRPADAHLQFFVYRSAVGTPPPGPGGVTPFPAPWRPLPPDVTDLFLTEDGTRAQALWIGARFHNDRHATPSLSQLRVDYDQDSYLPYLPAIYREGSCDDFLLRLLSLFESCFDEIERKVDGLPGLADVNAAPSSVLPWLASFLALPLRETSHTTEQREAIGGAYERYARRGTAAGLRDTLRIEAGIRAVIDEPIGTTGWWGMPAPADCAPGSAAVEWSEGRNSVLGINTVLVSDEPQGAVVGSTATLDRSQLIGQDEYGTPLFEGVAHRFTVSVYPGDVECAGRLDRIRAIVDREKPAHTMYEVCVIAPGIRIGYQARLGVDTLLGGGPRSPARLGESPLVLGGSPRGAMGIRSQVGVSTQL